MEGHDKGATEILEMLIKYVYFLLVHGLINRASIIYICIIRVWVEINKLIE